MKYSREWAMPNPDTFMMFPVACLLKKYVPANNNNWIDPFSGWNSPAFIKNDINPQIPANSHLDCVEFVESLHGLFDGCLLDPPYSHRQILECYKSFGLRKPVSVLKDLIAPIVKNDGYVITFGYDTNGMGIERGFEMVEILIINHGGSHNDTLVTVEQKTQYELSINEI